MDFKSLNNTLMFAACETRQCVTVTIVDDSEDELYENLFYTLEEFPSLNPNIELNPVEVEIVIIDDDG